MPLAVVRGRISRKPEPGCLLAIHSMQKHETNTFYSVLDICLLFLLVLSLLVHVCSLRTRKEPLFYVYPEAEPV